MIFSTSTSTAFVSVSYLLIASLSLVRNAFAGTADDWRGRSIYQLITDRFALTNGSITTPCSDSAQLYCGGTFQGIINKLDYIQGMGFTAIWISPVVQNIPDQGTFGEAYHGFWTQDITKINAHFGTADDLKALSKALHDRDMYLMIDVVANNMAAVGDADNVVYSNFNPFNKQEYFHAPCQITNYTDPTNAQNCWLAESVVSLPDMDTENSFVQSTWDQWGKDIVSTYSLDGLRIDATKHVPKPFWNSFQSSVNVFTIGEVYTDEFPAACTYMTNALNSVLNYPLWYNITGIISNPQAPMSGLQTRYEQDTQYCQDSTLLGTFSENHDVQRFASFTSDMALLKNALAYDIMGDGIPVIYYGAEQGFNGTSDPYNREALWLSGYPTDSPLYKHVAALNTARNIIRAQATFTYWSSYWTYKTKIITAEDDVLVLRKGYDHSIVTVLTNRGSNAPKIGPYVIGDTNFNSGDTIVEVLACTSMVVGQYGVFTVTLPPGGLPMVWVPAKWLKNTTLCPSIVSSAPANNPPSSTAPRALTPISSSISALSFLILTIVTLI